MEARLPAQLRPWSRCYAVGQCPHTMGTEDQRCSMESLVRPGCCLAGGRAA